MYWQYFEQLDKITSAKTPLQLTKKLFVERNTDKGPVIEPIEKTYNRILEINDEIKKRQHLKGLFVLSPTKYSKEINHRI